MAYRLRTRTRLGQEGDIFVPPATQPSPWAQAITTIAKGVATVTPAVAQVISATRGQPAAPTYVIAAAPPTYTPAMGVQPAAAAMMPAGALPTWGWVALGVVGFGVVAFALTRR